MMLKNSVYELNLKYLYKYNIIYIECLKIINMFKFLNLYKPDTSVRTS